MKAKVGRPRLPKGTAKGRIVPVRFTADDLKTMAAAAKASSQTVSEWIRSTIHAGLNPKNFKLGHYPGSVVRTVDGAAFEPCNLTCVKRMCFRPSLEHHL